MVKGKLREGFVVLGSDERSLLCDQVLLFGIARFEKLFASGLDGQSV